MTNTPDTRRLLTALRRDDLESMLGSRTRAEATLKWLHRTVPVPTSIPESIEGVSHRQWRAVRETCALPAWRILEKAPSSDGTIKYAIELGGAAVETVLIPAKGRSTVCVSSQFGCTRNCRFCATAKLGFGRNLSAGEIVLQYLVARAEAPAGAPARNIVFMGMGEPMDNLDEVLAAIEVLTQSPAPQLSPAHLTVSTSGVLPGIERFLATSRAHLALSLNGTTDEQRGALMPQTKVWPIASLLDALRKDRAQQPDRTHFIEYVLFDGINDADDDAFRLIRLLDGINARVNLIPFNASPGDELRPPADERVHRFQSIVHHGGIRCLVRWPRGREVRGACGQLAMAIKDAAVELPPMPRPRIAR